MHLIVRVCAGFLAICSIAAACAGDRPTLATEILLDELPAEPALQATPQSDSEAAPIFPTVTPASEQPTPAADETTASTPDDEQPELQPEVEVELLRPEIVATYPHDPNAFTQGLLVDDGSLIESTGMRFESDLRRVEIETGDVIAIVDAPEPELFAEGLARVDDEYIQLTWTSGRAFWWTRDFELVREESYEGEGWGLCYDGSRLTMSDGSSMLTFRDPQTFAITGSVDVTLNGEPVQRLNELECVGGVVWANVWQSNLIVRIDPRTGLVDATVDASELAETIPQGADVLNGIAWDASTETFLVTGKYWPTMFRVRFEATSSS